MASKRPALGRNLGVLLSDTNLKAAQQSDDAGHVKELSVSLLQPGQYQPRKVIEPDALQELADSIAAQGVIQPIIVRKLSARKYEIIAGERRWRASQLAGLKQVPVIVRDISDQAAIAMALIENIQREDLNPIEEADALQRLIKEFGMTHEQAAQAVGRSRTAVSNLLRLLALAPGAKQALERGDIEMGHARALLSLSASQQERFVIDIIENELTVRQTEQRVRQLNESAKPSASNRTSPDPDLVRVEKQLSQLLGAPVNIDHKASGKGRLTIKYKSLQHFEELLALLQSAVVDS